jgi:starvation-inducible outer membrane lipoprotein
MKQFYRFQKAICLHTAAFGLMGLLSACASPLPKEYIDQAERGVTLTSLTSDPDRYQGKVVILGGVIVQEKEEGGQVWLRLRNRPLDKDYVPHRPQSLDSPEAGYYWVLILRRDLPTEYRDWARVTVVGKVEGPRRSPADRPNDIEPVLDAYYLRGWGDSVMSTGKSTSTIDRNYTTTVPKGARGEFSQ